MKRTKNDGNALPAKTVRCAIYTRKSTEEGLEQEFNSLDAQRESAEAFVASQQHEGWVCLTERYDDGGFTGGNLDRPALRRLLSDIETGKIDCVIVYKVDRLSRSLLDFAKLVEVFEKRNVSFVSVTQQFNTATSMGRLVLNVLLSFAQFEREIIGERIRDKIAATRRKGKWAGGYPVLGYDVDRSAGSPRLLINSTEAARVREIYQLYLSLGSLTPVFEELARRGWKNKVWSTKKGTTKGGRHFDKGSLYALLTNPIYIGKIRHKTDLFQGQHDPIVQTDLYQRVEALLHQNCRSGGVMNRNRHGALLRGLVACAGCKRTMSHSFARKGDKLYRYYTCTRALKESRKSCPSGSLPAGEIERLVIDQIRGIATDPIVRAGVFAQADNQFELTLAELTTEKRGLEKELTRHHADIRHFCGKGPATGQVSNRLAEINELVKTAESRLAEVRQRIESHLRSRLDANDIEVAFADFDNVWNALSPREQCRVLSLLIAKVEFNAADSTVSVSFHVTGFKELSKQKVGDAA